MKADRHIATVRAAICNGLAALFMLSGFAKVADSQGFITTVQAHGVVSAPTATFVASSLPWIEVLVGVGALWSAANGYGLRRSIFAAALLFGIFSAYAWFLVASPPTKPAGCGCGFSKAPVEDWSWIAWRNTASTVLLGVVALTRYRFAEPERAAVMAS
jgi:hypothetical protein